MLFELFQQHSIFGVLSIATLENTGYNRQEMGSQAPLREMWITMLLVVVAKLYSSLSN